MFAKQPVADGEAEQAWAVWDTTARLYQNIDSVADFQRYALRRRKGLNADIPPAEPADTEDEQPETEGITSGA